MNSPIRVLVVDDSALMRQMISRFLTEAGMDVVGIARDGVDGLEKVARFRPDVVTLDVEMPRMDGLEMLRRLMRDDPRPVVMVSSVTQAQAPAAVEALVLGAVDVVAKPGGAISVNLDQVRDEIVTKVRLAAGVKVRRSGGPAPPDTTPSRAAETGPRRGDGAAATRSLRPAAPGDPTSTAVRPPPYTARRHPPPAARRPSAPSVDDDTSSRAAGRADTALAPGPVIIGSSTGGPGALGAVLGGLDADFPRPVVIVQHMPAGFTASLAQRLHARCALDVAEAPDGVRPRPGQVWVAPGGVHVVFDEEGRLVHSDAPPHLGVRPAVDLTLESAVSVWGGDVVAVILTGMGVDGARGARALKQAGGRVLAQDESTSVVYGMPRAVKELGLAWGVYPLHEMAAALTAAAAMPSADVH